MKWQKVFFGIVLALVAGVFVWRSAGNTVVSRVNAGNSAVSGLRDEAAPALVAAEEPAPRIARAPEPSRGMHGGYGNAQPIAPSPARARPTGATVGSTTAAWPVSPPPPQLVPSVASPDPRGVGSDTTPSMDPNGRFATTYRPGHGHLAGFEAAVARGTIPASARELVGELGGRYSPELTVPAGRALAYRVDTSRSALAPAGGPLQLRIALRSTETAATARPPMSVHVVLDVSNSMAGNSIEQARAAAQTLVRRLLPTDHFSLTAFGGTASVRVPEGLVGPRLQTILDTIAGLQLEGGTNISEGLTLGYGEAARGPQGAEWVTLVMLLSDGRPNAGMTRAADLSTLSARAFQSGVQTSSFGLGEDYDGALMSGIADQGAGGYYYIRDASGIADALTTELESRLQPVAQGVEVRVRLRPDVRLVQTYGARRLDAAESAAVRAQEVAVDEQSARRDHIARDRHDDVDGGMRFFIPGFARADQHVILLGLDVPAGSTTRPLAQVELRFKDRIARRNVVDELPVRVAWADSEAASAATQDASMLRTVQGFEAGQTLTAAAARVGAGDTEAARAMLGERAQLLRRASEALHEPRFVEDAARLERFQSLLGGAGDLSSPLVLQMLLDTSGRGMLH